MSGKENPEADPDRMAEIRLFGLSFDSKQLPLRRDVVSPTIPPFESQYDSLGLAGRFTITRKTARAGASLRQRTSFGAAMSPRDFKLSTPVRKVVKKLSKFLRIQQQTPTYARPIGPSPSAAVLVDSPSLLTAVSVDVMEEICLFLLDQDIVRMKQVQ